MEFLNSRKHNQHCANRPSGDCEEAERLNTKLLKASAVEQTFTYSVCTCRKQTDRKGSPDTVCHMYSASADRVINM